MKTWTTIRMVLNIEIQDKRDEDIFKFVQIRFINVSNKKK